MISEIIPTEKKLEDEFFSSFISDNAEDINTLNEYYFWLVEFLSSKFCKLGVSREDLEREAYYALLDAACSYRTTEDSRFGLYAIPLIREKLVNLISDTAMTSLGVKKVSDILFKAKNLSNMVSNNVFNDSTDWKAAQALGIDESILNELIFGKLSKSSINEILKNSKSSVQNIARKQSDNASGIMKNVSHFFNNIFDNFED